MPEQPRRISPDSPEPVGTAQNAGTTTKVGAIFLTATRLLLSHRRKGRPQRFRGAGCGCRRRIIAVAKKIDNFRYDPAKDSFKGWLLYLTRKQIALVYRKARAKPPAPNANEACRPDRANRRSGGRKHRGGVGRGMDARDLGGGRWAKVKRSGGRQTIPDVPIIRCQRDSRRRRCQGAG